MIDQDIIKRIIELSEFDKQNDAQEMQDHLEEINDLAISLLLQAKADARAKAKAAEGPWLTNGNNDFGPRGLPTDGAWPASSDGMSGFRG
jgi:hypothetical protein